MSTPILSMVEGGLYRNLLGAEVTLLHMQGWSLAPGVWLAEVRGIGREYVTEAGLLACGYALAAEESTDAEIGDTE